MQDDADWLIVAGGQLVFVEHVLADRAKMPFLLAAQVALRPVQLALCNGCRSEKCLSRLVAADMVMLATGLGY